MKSMKMTVVGCGRWGSFIGWYLDQIGHQVTFYGPENAADMQTYKKTRTNGIVTLRESIGLSSDLNEALTADAIVISIPSQALRGFLSEVLATGCDISQKKFILCMKGLEIETGKRLTEVFEDVTGSADNVAVWIGPGHVQEFVKGVPNCMVIDSKNDALKTQLIDAFKSKLIRFYYGTDLIGNEIGAASKNVIGIAAGILDGIGTSSLKGALMSRGTREISRLIEACGGNGLSAYGLCHLGDYEATVFSKYSHNRAFGEMFAKNETFPALAEGYYTAKAIVNLAKMKNVDLPICSAVYRLLYEKTDLQEELNGLFLRSLKSEF